MDRPQLPARIDPALYAYLKYLRDRLALLEKATGIEDTPSGSDLNDERFSDETFTYHATAVVLAGVGETEDTEDAWTTVASSAPATARYAMVQFLIHAESDAAEGQIAWRSASGSQEVVAGVVGSTEDDAEGQRPGYGCWFVPLTSGGFDYKADTTAGTVDWEVLELGYVL
jgi:hypothetical protein